LEKDWAKGEREKQGLEIKKEKEEKQKSADDSERLRQSAEHIYNKMKSPELEKMHQEAERSSYYRFVLKDKVEKEEMTLDDALKEASIVLISGRIDKKQNP
jgi:molybdopterin biosynthesis enzyme MoaB